MINKQRLIDTFIELVQIDSPSGEEQKFAQFLAEKLTKIGGTVQFDTTGNLIAKFAGAGEPFILNAHMDTVEPGRGIKPIIKGDTIISDGTTIVGGDDKSGITVILETLTSLREDKKTHNPIEVVLTIDEEEGMVGSKNLDYSLLSAKQGLTLDEEGSIANIDISSPGYVFVDAIITGRASHAGVEPEKGISAIKIASEIISQLRLGRIDEETTANIGLIHGGSVRNSIPETVEFHGEIRSRNKTMLKNHMHHFQQVCDTVMQKYPKASIDLSINLAVEGYVFQTDSPLLEKVEKILSEMNLKPNFKHSGGLTDVNNFHKKGIQAVAVGAGCYTPHTTREHVSIPEMLQAAQFCEKIVQT